MDTDNDAYDLSGLHREFDLLKFRMCRCNHQGTCIACKGFELLREQSQMVFAAASQPVLMQVAQEAAMKDLIGQMGQLQTKLVGDPEVQTLVERLMERVQEDMGGPEALEQFLSSMGLSGMPPQGFPKWNSGFDGFGIPEDSPPDDTPPQDTPPSQ